jgi:hypothetical protein
MSMHRTGRKKRSPVPVVMVTNVNPLLPLISAILWISESYERAQARENLAAIVDSVDRETGGGPSRWESNLAVLFGQ